MAQIMVLDDEVELHELYIASLRKLGSVQCFERLPTGGALPVADCYVIDFTIPGSTFEQALVATRNIPVVLVTGHLERMFEFQVIKPFAVAELLQTVDKAMKNWKSSAPELSVKKGDKVEFELDGKSQSLKVAEVISPFFLKVDLRFSHFFLRANAVRKVLTGA